MLWIYYAFIKTDEYLLITINSFGCVIETIYITMFLAYAPRKIKVYTAKVILFLNVGVFSLIVLSTLLLTKGPNRVKLLGWLCVGFAVSVFAAPLSIIVRNIYTFMQTCKNTYTRTFMRIFFLCSCYSLDTAEASHQDKKCRVHAILSIVLPNLERRCLVLVRSVHKRHLCRGNFQNFPSFFFRLIIL